MFVKYAAVKVGHLFGQNTQIKLQVMSDIDKDGDHLKTQKGRLVY